MPMKAPAPGHSGGVVVDGGRAELADVTISGAESGVTLLGGGTVAVRGAVAVDNSRVGVSLFPFRGVAWEGNGTVTAAGNAVGAVRFPGAPALPAGFRVERSEEADLISWDAAPGERRADRETAPSPSPGARRIPDTFVEADRTLEGDVVVDGIVRVAPGATLTILPGARLFFTFRDTDGDGIGENGIFLQGNLCARGTADRPIGFYPEQGRGPGRWDSINFMASDGGENVLEHVEIVGAYRGLHAHFSRLSGTDVRIADCYRGVQFQESDVTFQGLRITRFVEGVRCRDSEVRIDGFELSDTVSGELLPERVSLRGPDRSRRVVRFPVPRKPGGSPGRRVAGSWSGVGPGRELSAEGVEFAGNGLAAVGVLEGNVTLNRCALNREPRGRDRGDAGKVSVLGGRSRRYGRHAVSRAVRRR
jgi:hypothetical protein